MKSHYPHRHSTARPLLSTLLTLIPAAVVALWAYTAKASVETAFSGIDLISAATDIDSDWVATPQSNSTPVKTLQIEGLAEFAGQNLTVFYVSGRRTSAQSVNVRTILTPPVKVSIGSSGRASIPATHVPKQGFDTFSAIVFVVHAQPEVYLKNADGTPKDPRLSDSEVLPASAYDSQKQWVMLVNELDMSQSAIAITFK